MLFILLLKTCYNWMVKDLRPNGYEPFHMFKVDSHILNWLLILLYFSLFVILIFVFRLYRVGYEFDLKPFISFVQDIIVEKDYIFLCMLITGLLCISLIFVGIMKRMKHFLTVELLKRHLILHAKSFVTQKRTFHMLLQFLDMLKYFFAGLEYPGNHLDINMGSQGIYIHLQEVYNALFSRGIIARRLSRPFIFLYHLTNEFNFHTKFFFN